MRLRPKQRVWRILAAPGATYRIVAWGVEGTRDRSQLPRVLAVKNEESGEFIWKFMEYYGRTYVYIHIIVYNM